MGIWIELGVFIVVLAWGLWQLHDTKKALARSRAKRAETPSGETAAPDKTATDEADPGTTHSRPDRF